MLELQNPHLGFPAEGVAAGLHVENHGPVSQIHGKILRCEVKIIIQNCADMGLCHCPSVAAHISTLSCSLYEKEVIFLLQLGARAKCK